MENKKGARIFLGLVSAATLIVAIIGATFAYFSATASSNTDAINLSAYEFDMDILVEMVSPSESTTGLIPMDPNAIVGDSTNLLVAINTGGSGHGYCEDDNGFQVCALYKVTVHNYGEQEETLDFSVKNISNVAGSKMGATPYEDLVLQTLSGSTNSFELSDEDPVMLLKTLTNSGAEYNEETNPYLETVPINKDFITVDGATDAENPGEEVFYFAVYLDDTDVAVDQSSQMGARYNGQVILSTGGNKLTGTFQDVPGLD